MDYRTLYFTLFSVIETAISQIDCMNFGSARETLIQAQQNAENLFLAQDERAE